MIQERLVLSDSPRLFLNLTAPRRWASVKLSVGATPLGPPLSREDLLEGAAYTLPDGSELTVRLEKSLLASLLRIERDGEVVPGSEASAERLTRRAGAWLIGIGLLNGFGGMVLPVPDDIRNVIYLIALFYGAVGYFSRRGSYPALALGSGFYLLTLLRSAMTQSIWGLVLPFAMALPLIRALLAHQRERRGARAEGPRVPRVVSPPGRVMTRTPPAPASTPQFAETIAPGVVPRVARPTVPTTEPALGDSAFLPMTASPFGGAGEVVRDLDFVPAEAPGAEAIGPYEIVEQIGAGGMATVYRARQKSVGRDVALKVIAAEHLSGPGFYERFRREAETTAQLSDPHILKVFDYGEHGGRPYLAMEFMRGGTLRGRMTGAPLTPAQVVRWAEQVGQAIQSAHRQGVIHRDIKPENVLLDQSGNAFLADFGLARLHNASSSLSASGTQMGSPTYMAPEQWDGSEVSRGTDLYAFGVMLYELLAGEPPFLAANLPALMALHLEGEIPSPRARRPDLPVALDAFFRKALAKAPSQRFTAADAMVASLRQALRVGATTTAPSLRPAVTRPPARPGSVSKSGSSPSPRRPAWHVPVGIAAVVVAGLAVWSLRSPLATTAPVPGPSPRRAITREAAGAASRLTPPAAVIPAATLDGDVYPLDFKVTDAAFSTSLNRIVAIGGDTVARVIDPDTGRISRIDLSAPARSVAVSPDGFMGVVGHEFAVSSINLTSGRVERMIPVDFRGATAVMGPWAYILPERRRPSLHSVNLQTGEVKVLSDSVHLGRSIKPHASGRRLYMADQYLSPDDLFRVDAQLGPASAVKDSRYHGDHDVCEELWLSEAGDLAFTACGNVFSLSEDLARDMEFAGQIPDLQDRRIAALAHSSSAGRIMFMLRERVPGYKEEPRDVLLTLEFPGFRFVSRDILPRLGSEDRPVRASGQFVFASREGGRAYVVLQAPAAESRVASAIYAGPMR